MKERKHGPVNGWGWCWVGGLGHLGARGHCNRQLVSPAQDFSQWVLGSPPAESPGSCLKYNGDRDCGYLGGVLDFNQREHFQHFII